MSFVARDASQMKMRDRYNTVPYFWTMIFGKSLRYVGSTGGKDGSNFFDNVIIEGDFKESRFVAYYCRVKGASFLGRSEAVLVIFLRVIIFWQ